MFLAEHPANTIDPEQANHLGVIRAFLARLFRHDPAPSYPEAYAAYWSAAASRDTRRMHELYPTLQRALHAKLRAEVR